MYSHIKFKKNIELHWIYFPVWLGGSKGINAPGKDSDPSDFDGNKNITTEPSVKSISKILLSYSNI